MKIKEIRGMDKNELSKRLSELRLELMKEIANVKRGRPMKNPGKIKVLRKSIARIITVKKQLDGVKK